MIKGEMIKKLEWKSISCLEEIDSDYSVTTNYFLFSNVTAGAPKKTSIGSFVSPHHMDAVPNKNIGGPCFLL